MGIKVVATEKGFYGQFREPGDEFEIAGEEAFADIWMERVGGKRRAIKPAGGNTTGNNPVGAMDPNSELDPV